MMLTVSCSSDTDDLIQEENPTAQLKKVTVGVALPGDNDTRVTFDNDITKMVWSEGDRLTLVGYDGNNMYSSNSLSSPIKSGQNSKQASFEVAVNPEWSSCQFAYLGERAYVDPQNFYNPFAVNCNEQVQNEAGDFSGIQNHMLLKSDVMFPSDLLYNNSMIMLSPVTSVLRLNIKNLPEQMKSASSYDINFYLNYDVPGSEVCKASLKYNGSITEGADNYIYMAFMPYPEYLKKDHKIAFEILTEDYEAVAYAVASEAKFYENGKIYTAVLDYNDQSNLTWNVGEKSEYTEIYVDNMLNNPGGIWYEETITGKPGSWGYNGYLECATRYAYSKVLETYWKLKPVTLLNENTISFDHSCVDMSHKDLQANFVIRKLGDTDWTTLPISYPAGEEFESSGVIAIPAEYNGMEVEFAFRVMKAKGDGNFIWRIKNFVINGK